jgi:hypothetical protein
VSRECVVVLVAMMAVAGPVLNAADASAAKDKVRLNETIISGNQELPKVLYIQPWQDSSALPDLGIETKLSLRDVLRPIYPPAYRRELELHDRLNGDTTAGASMNKD